MKDTEIIDITDRENQLQASMCGRSEKSYTQRSECIRSDGIHDNRQ